MDYIKELYYYGFQSLYSLSEFEQKLGLGLCHTMTIISFYHRCLENYKLDSALWALNYINIDRHKYELLPTKVLSYKNQSMWITLLKRILNDDNIREIAYDILNDTKHIASEHKNLLDMVNKELKRRKENMYRR